MNKSPLSETHPALAAEAIGWDPTQVSAGSNRRVLWRCPKGHEFESVISNRTRNQGCPVCGGRRVREGFNDLHTQNPRLAAEADGWNPKEIHETSNKKLPWKCSIGHQWSATVSSRSTGGGCPVCANRQVQKNFNDLKTLHPEIAAEAYGWDPGEVLAGTTKVFSWRCKKGHVWDAKVVNRVNGSGCHYCAGTAVGKGINDLEHLHPDLAAEADGWEPSTVTAHSRKKLPWVCSNNHKWIQDPSHRVDGAGCPVCTNRIVIPGQNDLVTTNSELAAEADGWDPTTVSAETAKSLPWKCAEGHTWKATVSDRTRRGSGCPYCFGRYAWPGFNDLVTTHPELAAEADGWDPATVSFGSSKRVKWKCKEGHTWRTTVGSRTREEASGCPSCATSGFNPSLPSYLYLLNNELWGLLQIGISNDLERRLKEHGEHWDVIEIRGPMPGDVTRQWEKDILHALERRGVELSPEHIAGKFSGYTEAWVQEEFPAKTLKELMEIVHEDENNSRST